MSAGNRRPCADVGWLAAFSAARKQRYSDQNYHYARKRSDAQHLSVYENPCACDARDREAGRNGVGGTQWETTQSVEIAAEEGEAEKASDQERGLEHGPSDGQPGSIRASVLDEILERDVGADVCGNGEKQENPAAQIVIPSMPHTGSECPALMSLPSPQANLDFGLRVAVVDENGQLRVSPFSCGRTVTSMSEVVVTRLVGCSA